MIGGGPAGMAAALRASERGADVALVERDTGLGGIL
ncbi:MAG: FAD-dependent oxidoreductase, partial [Synergistaceae bacterium]|nr:FAD-dependent oxidoreductase [Synergistaceae bacterium]